MYRTDMPLAQHNANTVHALVTNIIEVKELDTSNSLPACYQTDERYFCEGNCCWKSSCKALTATWLRRN